MVEKVRHPQAVEAIWQRSLTLAAQSAKHDDNAARERLERIRIENEARAQSFEMREKEFATAARERERALADSRDHLLSTLRMLESDRATLRARETRIAALEAQVEDYRRPWLTLALDVHTRMICGFHVSLNPPSQLSVALCLTHAVLAKDGWLAERHLDLNWPAAGLMKSLHSDNGRDLHGKGLEMGSREWGIQWVFRPPATPHFGGHIERLIGTVMGAVHLLPGTTYSNTQERGNYASEDAATLSMAELESWLAIQICEGYHQTPHSALGMTPTMAWKLAVHHGMEVVMPSDSRRLLLSFLPVVRRTLQRSGLYVNNIRCWSDMLPAIAPVGEEVFLRVDPRNLSKIYVRARDGAYVDVPYADIRYPPISHRWLR